jgi:hypothetical protein
MIWNTSALTGALAAQYKGIEPYREHLDGTISLEKHMIP